MLTGDISSVSFFGKCPPAEWIKENQIITQDEEGNVNFDTDKLFPMLRPDNLKVRQLHTLLSKDILTRFSKKKLFLEMLPYFTALGTVVICFMMVVITMNAIGKM